MVKGFDEEAYQTTDFKVSKKVAVQQARLTVPNVYCALVELITNSDDSYSEIEKANKKASGLIEVYVAREKATSRCLLIGVRDEAEGMSSGKLHNAMEYGETSQAAQASRTSRGLFNRGLKEAVLAMGHSEVQTSDEREVSSVRLSVTQSGDPDQKEHPPIACTDFDFGSSQLTTAGRGTVVCIGVTEEKFVIPGAETFKDNLRRHYALRHILRNPAREIVLYFHDVSKGKSVTTVTFSTSTNCTKYTLGFNDLDMAKPTVVDIRETQSGHRYHMRIWESPQLLEVKNEDWDLAGIVVYTSCRGKVYAIDFEKFGFDSDPLVGHFYGELECDALDQLARESLVGKGDAIIRSDRSGLLWKRHPLLRRIWSDVSRQLKQLTDQKRATGKPLRPSVASSDNQKKFFKEINKLARHFLQSPPSGTTTIPPTGKGGSPHLDLRLIPKTLYLPIGKSQELTVAVEKRALNHGNSVDSAVIEESHPGCVKLSSSKATLRPYSKYKYRSTVSVEGKIDGSKATIIAKYGPFDCQANVFMKEPPEKGVLFTGYDYDLQNDPTQRSYRDSSGCVWICVNHPATRAYYENPKNPFKSKEGKAMLSELISEAVCYHVANLKLEKEGAIRDVDAFLGRMRSFQKKVLPLIHQNIDLLVARQRGRKAKVRSAT